MCQELNEAIQVQQEQIIQASRGLDYCHQTEQFCQSIQEIEFQKALLISNNKIFYFICLLKYRDLLLATPLISSDDALKTGCLEFPNYVQMSNLPHDFNLEVNLYALVSTSAFGVQDTCFQLMGQVDISLPSIRQRKFALQGVIRSAPIENVIFMKLRCCIEGVESVERRGFLNIYEELSDLGAWSRYWCIMRDGMLKFWRYPEDVEQNPIFSINLSHCSKFIESLTSDVCARPNTMEMDVSASGPDVPSKRYLLSAETRDELKKWANNVKVTLREFRMWNPDLSTVSDV
ncbi:unnamed protein product [Soboliphyme baturini]|uniref:PH domain-containing protein n=1 Tax=Soboliphyme baturini TaxID=241478 RepID=A0A3P8ARY8_9BILA|nr:unnamed protein product [Soboliphyme baturini]